VIDSFQRPPRRLGSTTEVYSQISMPQTTTHCALQKVKKLRFAAQVYIPATKPRLCFWEAIISLHCPKNPNGKHYLIANNNYSLPHNKTYNSEEKQPLRFLYEGGYLSTPANDSQPEPW